MQDRQFFERRALLQATALGVMGIVALTVAPGAQAEDLPRLTEDDETAKSLKYVHDATQSQRPDDSQFCHNCRYFKGDAETGWARCDLFPGKLVNAQGWCSVWAEAG
jgi:hypothetical protein